jgi:ribosomal protein L9
MVDKHKIELDQPIKSLGTYKVAIKVHSGMTPEVTIVVEPKG